MMTNNYTKERILLSRRRSSGRSAVILLALLLPILLLTPCGPAAAGQDAGDQPAAGGEEIFLPIVSVAECQTYYESGRLLVMEVEHAPLVPYWQAETGLPGFTGDSYYTWRGPNFFGAPGEGILSYNFQISNPGLYNFRLHNRHDFIDPTEENDVWARMDNGPWVKVFSWVSGSWNWATAFDVHGNISNPEYLLGANNHTLQISGRSYGFSIDRIVMFVTGAVWDDLSIPESPCS